MIHLESPDETSRYWIVVVLHFFINEIDYDFCWSFKKNKLYSFINVPIMIIGCGLQ